MIRRWTRNFARSRASGPQRHPLRTYVKVPLLRSLTLWFTPRVELLPSSGHLWPLREEWQDDRPDFLVTLGLTVVNVIYIALALAGAWMARRRPGVALLIVFMRGAHAIFREVRGNARAALCAGMFSRGDRARRAGFSRARSDSAFFYRLGMNGQAENLREVFFHAVFQRGGDVVDFGDRQAAVHGAVAGDQNFVLHAADVHFVAVGELVIFRLQ